MQFLYGSALLVAAFAVLCIGRRLLAGLGPKRDDEIIDPAEALAFLITVVAAFGVAKIAMTAFADWSLVVALELTAALAGTVVACYALRLVMHRLLPAQADADETPQKPLAPQTPPTRGPRRDAGANSTPGLPKVHRAA